MVNRHCGDSESAVLGVKTHPASNPPLTGVQGLLNADWVTLWLPGLHRNII